MEQVPNPSGSFLPLLLRRKWRDEKIEAEKSSSSTVPTTSVGPNALKLNPSREDNNSTIALQPHPGLTKTETSILSNRIFTAADLEERIWKTTVAMVDIQKQIHRGEETYYEDTYSHGNLFRGWDAFVDAKDVGNASGTSNPQPTNRRVPGDFRWFSGSCRSVSRSARPTPLTRSLPSSNSNSRHSSNNTPTMNSSMSIQSETNTNTPTSALVGAATATATATATSESVAVSQGTTNDTVAVSTEKKKSQTVVESTPNTRIAPEDGSSLTASKTEKNSGVQSSKVDTPKEMEIDNVVESSNKRKEPGMDGTSDKVEEPPAKKANKGSGVEEPPTGTKDSNTSKAMEKSSVEQQAQAAGGERDDETKNVEEQGGASKAEVVASEKDTEKNTLEAEKKVDGGDSTTETATGSKKVPKSPTIDSTGDVSKEEKTKREDPQKRRMTRNRKAAEGD